MVRILLLGVVLVQQLGGAALYGQCSNGRCTPMAAPPRGAVFSAERHATDPEWIGLYHGVRQVAALDEVTGKVYPVCPKTGSFACACDLVGQALAASVAADGPQGVDRRGILAEGERYTLDGRRASTREVWQVMQSTGGVPDDSAAPSLTLIGGKEQCSAALAAIQADPAGAELLGRFLVQSFRPDNPLVAGAGFVCDGAPSIYGQLPDGRTLFRSAGAVNVAELIGAMMRGVEVAEGKRVPDPTYTPNADAGLTVKPQVDATVTAPPWFYALTHLGALVLGGMGALGGRWALISMVLTPAVQALEDRMLSKIQAPPVAAAPAAQPPQAAK